MAATSTVVRTPEAAQPAGDALPPRRRRRTPVWASQRVLKATMAITGTVMALFVVVHMVGNLKVLAGPEAFNGYAAWLRQVAYPLLPHVGRLIAPEGFQAPTTSNGELQVSAYHNLVASLSRPGMAVFYSLVMLALSLHLAQGLWNVVIDLGGTGPRLRRVCRAVALAVALAIAVVNGLLPVLICTGVIG